MPVLKIENLLDAEQKCGEYAALTASKRSTLGVVLSSL